MHRCNKFTWVPGQMVVKNSLNLMAYEEDGAGLIVCALNVTISSTKSGLSMDSRWPMKERPT